MMLPKRFRRCSSLLLVLSCALVPAEFVWAQADLPVYSDKLLNGFEDWSWASRNLNNSSPVRSGNRSISVSAAYWEAISFHHAVFNTGIYSNVTFWAHGGSTGGQRLQVVAEYGSTTGPPYQLPAALSANTWQQFTVPLGSLGVANRSDVHRLTIQLTASGTSGTFYVDDIQFTAKPAPAVVQLAVNAAQQIRSVDARWFGANAAVWDSDFESPQTLAALREMGCMALRFPGGSLSDEYHWAINRSGNNNFDWATSFTDFARHATNLGAEVFITVNYGTGTAAEAAAWVRHSNVTNNYGFKCWEVGNENYGPWETDNTGFPHDPYTYAVRAKDYIEQMKAADPAIKIGVVVVPGEDSYSNAFSQNHPAVNSRTGDTNTGWTPVLLTTLKDLGVTPDFLVHHFYPQNAGGESDVLLLQSAAQWASDAADLRQQLADYFGPGHTNVELVCTENNSISSNPGKQTTSLINALFVADSFGQLAKTEFNALVWWDIRNGTDFSNNNDASLYGWRNFGDYGFLSGTTTYYPPFYAMKLLQHFARPGDQVLEATSDYPLLSAYATRRNGGALVLLVINKDSATNFNAQITLNEFVPDASATVHTFGIPQDEAARTNGPAQSQDIASADFNTAAAGFNHSFPPLSLTLFTFAPAAPQLTLPTIQAGAVVLELQGQPGSWYVVQSSTNLVNWSAISTNTLVGSTLNMTNTLSADAAQRFWRALWSP